MVFVGIISRIRISLDLWLSRSMDLISVKWCRSFLPTVIPIYIRYSLVSYQRFLENLDFLWNNQLFLGLYPQHHGVIGNTVYSSATKREFDHNNAVHRRDVHKWVDAEPLWVTAKNQGKRSFLFHLPICDSSFAPLSPSYCVPYHNEFMTMDAMNDSVKEAVHVLRSGVAHMAGISSLYRSMKSYWRSHPSSGLQRPARPTDPQLRTPVRETIPGTAAVHRPRHPIAAGRHRRLRDQPGSAVRPRHGPDRNGPPDFSGTAHPAERGRACAEPGRVRGDLAPRRLLWKGTHASIDGQPRPGQSLQNVHP